jgi:hypothetical protein
MVADGHADRRKRTYIVETAAARLNFLDTAGTDLDGLEFFQPIKLSKKFSWLIGIFSVKS